MRRMSARESLAKYGQGKHENIADAPAYFYTHAKQSIRRQRHLSKAAKRGAVRKYRRYGRALQLITYVLKPYALNASRDFVHKSRPKHALSTAWGVMGSLCPTEGFQRYAPLWHWIIAAHARRAILRRLIRGLPPARHIH